MRDTLGISKIINPDLEASYDIYRMVKYVYATTVETFMDNKVSLVGLIITNKMNIVNMYLKDFRKKYDVIICMIQRDNEVYARVL